MVWLEESGGESTQFCNDDGRDGGLRMRASTIVFAFGPLRKKKATVTLLF
jgi:hypothetical protein